MGNPANAPSHWKRIGEQERAAVIINLRKEGLTFKEIAAQVGVDRSVAVRIVGTYLRKVITEPSQELLEKELLEVQNLYDAAMEAVRKFTPVISGGAVVQIPVMDAQGNPVKDANGGQEFVPMRDFSPMLMGVNTAVRLLEKKHKLLGLDAPQRIVNSTTMEPIEFRVIDSAAQLGGEIQELIKEVGEAKRALHPHPERVGHDAGADQGDPELSTPAADAPYRMLTDAE